MVNKNLFRNRGIAVRTPKHNTLNEAGGLAYSLSDTNALAQYVVTGTFNNTYYVSAEEQLKQVETLLATVTPEFVAKAAVYARKFGYMKDTPAYLTAWLAAKGHLDLFRRVFPQTIDNGKMLSNFVHLIRSGSLGRRSFGTAIKKEIQKWLNSHNSQWLFNTSIGLGNPSLQDVIKMVHPRPVDKFHENMYAYLLDRKYEETMLPEQVRLFELLKKGDTQVIPDVPFRVLTNCNLTPKQWKAIALAMPFNTLRMNLNSIARHGVFTDSEFTKTICEKLRTAEDIKKSRVFPYQLMTAYQNIDGSVPTSVGVALQDAMEIATENIPEFSGQTVVGVDVSGSMSYTSITGNNGHTSSKTTCVEVAALIASCILRKNPDAIILPFDTCVYDNVRLNPRDSVMTNAKILSMNGGGTDCSLPFKYVHAHDIRVNNFVLVSDNESWYNEGGVGRTATGWTVVKSRNPAAKLVNINIQPYMTTQVQNIPNEVLNIGGMSDVVFKVMAEFFARKSNVDFTEIVNQAISLNNDNKSEGEE